MTNPDQSPFILVAEDNEMNQRVIQIILEKSGYRFRLVKDGQEALDLFLRESFQLILMDCQMPHVDGLKATQKIRELEKSRDGKRVPIVALTANSMKGDRDVCLAAGMDDFLPKPFRMNELVEKIKRWTTNASS